MASRSVSIDRTKKIGIRLEDIQNFDAKIAFENWKKLGRENS